MSFLVFAFLHKETAMLENDASSIKLNFIEDASFKTTAVICVVFIYV